MYLYFVFDISFMTNTFIINMTVSTSMVLHMYGYTENKEMIIMIMNMDLKSESGSWTCVNCGMTLLSGNKET